MGTWSQWTSSINSIIDFKAFKLKKILKKKKTDLTETDDSETVNSNSNNVVHHTIEELASDKEKITSASMYCNQIYTSGVTLKTFITKSKLL